MIKTPTTGLPFSQSVCRDGDVDEDVRVVRIDIGPPRFCLSRPIMFLFAAFGVPISALSDGWIRLARYYLRACGKGAALSVGLRPRRPRRQKEYRVFRFVLISLNKMVTALDILPRRQ